MVPTTRRRLLSGSVALLAALAGCNGSRTSSTRSEPNRPENVERDPETRAIRMSGDGPAAWLPREDRGDGATTDAADGETPPTRTRQRGFVASAEAAERLRLAEVDGAEEARRFVEATDFEAETVYFETHRVRECYELELCYVTWSATEIDTQYGSYHRDAEVECETEAESGEDAEETTAWFIRVPDDLDPEAVTSHGSGWSGDGCHFPPHLRTTAQETETNDEVVARPVTTNATDGDAGSAATTSATTEDER
ncbi:hypothetical protein NGM10_17165 (plasmid) [Halorussus salilacus]|uniref:hypothetical protein n=1 Tax=Halorussus salilacus TaxID=2953750 RepID=UPI00209F38AF|nr:hypothetical protein [Halorussus salilacus]USZ69826.1 hypothetical protein NGM10_17165 [Halorussus salilacus]